MEEFKPFLARLARGETFSRADSEAAFDLLLTGKASPTQTAGFLMGLRARGETLEEMTGAVAAMRAKMLRVKAPADAMDIVGTGGDGAQTYNISTLAAIIVAACGVTVAKHGNRAASSLSGASDVLSELGVQIGVAPAIIEQSLAEAGIGFMTAQAHHPAMAAVAPVRRELGARTLFNLLGPLSNPAGVKRALIGVFSEAAMVPIAETLKNLGAEKIWVAHGADGLDEITTTAETKIVALENGALRAFTIAPEDVGLRRVTLDQLRGGDPAFNARALRGVLAGEKNPYRDIAAFNAAAALVVADKAPDLQTGFALACAALDSGEAARKLEKLIQISHRA